MTEPLPQRWQAPEEPSLDELLDSDNLHRLKSDLAFDGPTRTADYVERRREQIWQRGNDLLDTIKGEGRDMLASESRKFDKIVSDVVAIDDFVAEAQRTADQIRATREHLGDMPTTSLRSNPMNPTTKDVVAFARGETPNLDVSFEGLTRSLNAATGRMETRDITVSGVGDIVPTSFRTQLYEYMIESAAIRQTNVTVLNTSSGDPLTIPKATADSTAALVTEGGTIAGSDPTFDSVVLDSYKYGHLFKVSSEMLTDTGINLQGYLARQSGRAIGNATGTAYILGTGTAQPQGIVPAATVGKTGGTGNVGAPQADELIDLWSSVIPEYRNRGYWLMSSATWSGVRKLKDLNDNYLVAPIGAGGKLELLGRPVVLDPNVADAALNAKSVVFGDFGGYFIRDIEGIRFERSDDFAFSQDLVSFRALFRTDGDLVDTNALKVFVGAAS